MVSIWSKILNPGLPPATISTTIVSPIPLAKPKRIEAIIPLDAAGITILVAVSHFVAPTAKLDSLK